MHSLHSEFTSTAYHVKIIEAVEYSKLLKILIGAVAAAA